MRVLSKSVNLLILCDSIASILITSLTAVLLNFNFVFTIFACVLFALSSNFILNAKGYYEIRTYKFLGKDAYLLFEGVILSAIPLFILAFFFTPPKLTLLKFIGLEIVIFYFFILIFRTLFNLHRGFVKPDKKVLILGTGATALMVAKEIIERPLLKFQLIGFIENNPEKSDFSFLGIKVLGKSCDAKKIVEENKIDIIITSPDGIFDYQTQMDVAECVPCKVSFWKMYEFYEEITHKIPVSCVGPAWFLYDFGSVNRPFYKFFKRLMDISIGLTILLCASPILLILGIAIKLYDGGPIIFKQTRIGFNEKPFEVYKLRTMRMNKYVRKGLASVEHSDIITSKLVIPFCKWVRKMRIDELPQIINIIKGDMSLVGPRPEALDFVNIYIKDVPYYRHRHWVPVGLAGWQQAHQGHVVGLEATAERVGYDLYYIKHRNVFWDMGILVRTIGLALTKRAN